MTRHISLVFLVVLCLKASITVTGEVITVEKSKDVSESQGRGHHFYAVFVHLAYAVVTGFFILKIALGIAFLWMLSGIFYLFRGVKKLLRENDEHYWHHHDPHHHDYHHDYDYKDLKNFDNRYRRVNRYISAGPSNSAGYRRPQSQGEYSTVYKLNENGEMSPYRGYNRNGVRRKRDSGLGLLDRIRRSKEDCTKKHLCVLHAKAGTNPFASFQLYFVKKETASEWDHVEGRSIQDCEKLFAHCGHEGKENSIEESKEQVPASHHVNLEEKQSTFNEYDTYGDY